MVHVWQRDVLLVKYRDGEDDGSEEKVTGYFEKICNCWELTKKHIRLCKYHYMNTYDPMTYSHKLDTKIERLVLLGKGNKTKSTIIYRYYTILKHGNR